MGGHSVGIAHTGTAPVGGTVKATGTAGPGGAGGTSSGTTGGLGAPGVVAALEAFP